MRQFVNNKKIWWKLLKRKINYSICCVNPSANFHGCIVKNNGLGNKLIIADGAKVKYCTFCFNGNNNIVFIDKNCEINGCVFYLDDNNNQISIGKESTFTGKSELITTEGTKIDIGSDCMFAYGIVLRTGDHHSIFDNNRLRVNLPKNIKIGDHVWIGQNAYLLKGVEINDGCVIGACSVVTKVCSQSFSVYAGNPARLIKSDITWDRARILSK